MILWVVLEWYKIIIRLYVRDINDHRMVNIIRDRIVIILELYNFHNLWRRKSVWRY